MKWITWISAGYVLIRVIGHYADPASTRRYHVEAAWFVFAAIGWAAAVASANARDLARPRLTFTTRRFVALCALIAGVVVACYFPSLQLGLLSDDFSLIDRARTAAVFTTADGEFFRPVPLILWWGVGILTNDPAWLHALNLVMHAANGCLLALVAARVGMSAAAAAASGILFVTFPAHVEAVAWISGLQDVTMTTGCLVYLLATLATVDARQSLAMGAAGVGAMAIALLSKETAVVAPVLAIAVSFLLAPDARRAVRPWLAAGVAIAVVYAVWRIAVLPPPSGYDQSLTRYFGKELISRTFGALAVPWSAAVLTSMPWLGAASAVFALGAGVLAVACARLDRAHLRRVTIFLFWSLVAIVPVYSYFFIAPTLQGSRYLYLPACGWILFVVSTATVSADVFPKAWAVRACRAGILTMAVVGGAGVRSHQGPWIRAAALRDHLLSEVRKAAETNHCAPTQIEVADLPDAVDGAYVFRNGFHEAVRNMLPTTHSPAEPLSPDPAARCRFRWTENGLTGAARPFRGQARLPPGGTRLRGQARLTPSGARPQ